MHLGRRGRRSPADASRRDPFDPAASRWLRRRERRPDAFDRGRAEHDAPHGRRLHQREFEIADRLGPHLHQFVLDHRFDTGLVLRRAGELDHEGGAIAGRLELRRDAIHETRILADVAKEPALFGAAGAAAEDRVAEHQRIILRGRPGQRHDLLERDVVLVDARQRDLDLTRPVERNRRQVERRRAAGGVPRAEAALDRRSRPIRRHVADDDDRRDVRPHRLGVIRLDVVE